MKKTLFFSLAILLISTIADAAAAVDYYNVKVKLNNGKKAQALLIVGKQAVPPPSICGLDLCLPTIAAEQSDITGIEFGEGPVPFPAGQ